MVMQPREVIVSEYDVMPIRCGAPRAPSRRLAGLGRFVLLSLASLPLLLGQSPTTPAFEVTSVKVNKLRYPDIKYSEMSCSGTRFMARWYTPSSLIKWAYQLELSDPIGLPAWAGNMDRMYDIEAKAGAPMSED